VTKVCFYLSASCILYFISITYAISFSTAHANASDQPFRGNALHTDLIVSSCTYSENCPALSNKLSISCESNTESNEKDITYVARMIICPLSEMFPLLIQTSWCEMIDSHTESACSSLAPFSSKSSLATIPPLN